MTARRLCYLAAAALLVLCGYAAYVVQRPVCIVHPQPVGLGALGRAERSLLPQDARCIRYAWRAQGRSFCSLTRFEPADRAAFLAMHDFRPVQELPAAFASVPAELAALPWWQPQAAAGLLAAAVPECRAALVADAGAGVVYLLVLEND